MRFKTKATKALCALLATAMCVGTATPSMTAYAVTDTKPVNPDGTTPNWNKPQDIVSDDTSQYANQSVRLLVSKIKTAQGAHEGIAPETTNAQQDDTVTYKISGRVEGTITALEEKYGTGNVEFAYDAAGNYLGYGWMKGTYEYLLYRKAAAFPEDLDFEIIYDGGVFSGFAYVTRKLATAEDENRFVAGATMALYDAIEITRDNTITGDGKDVGEDHRFNGVQVTRNGDSTIDDIRVLKGHAGTMQAYVYQKDGQDKLTVDSYGYVIDKNYNPQDQINDLTNGTWITKTIQREDTPILYYNLDNLHVTTNDVYTKDTVDNVFGKERKDKENILYAFDKDRNVIDATQLKELDFSIYGFVGDETKPSFEFVGGDFDEIRYNESEKRIVVGKDTLIYHLDADGNRDSLVDPQTGIAYIEEKIDKREGHNNIHDTNNTDTESQQETKIYVWPVNISYDGSGSTSGNKNGSKTFSKIMGTRIATINADTENEYTTGTYENGSFVKRLYPTMDLYGRTIYYKQSSEIYTKGQDTWDYDGDVYTGWQYTDLLDGQNLNAYTINDHDTLYNGDKDDPFDQSTHYQYSKIQSVRLTIDENGYIVNGSLTVPVPKKEGYGFRGWIQSVTGLTDGANVYPSWSANPNSTMNDGMKNTWYSNREATGTTRTITVIFHANSNGDEDGSAEFVSGSGDIHSTDNKLYRRLGDAYLMYDKWVSGENTPNDPFDTTLVDTTENTAAGHNTLTGTSKTANDPYTNTMSGGMADMLKRVALGDYIMEEVSAPLGYVKGLPVGVTVNYSSEVQRAEMQDKTIKLELVKVDANEKDLSRYEFYVDGEHQLTEAGNPVTKTEQKLGFTYKEVTGAVFSITGTDGASKSALSSWAKVTSHPHVTQKTGDDGFTYIEVPLDAPIVLEGFPKGNYLATEVKTPSGAVTMKPQAFTVTENDGVQFNSFSDDHMKVEVEKYYMGTGDVITHLDNARRAELALIDANGNTIATWKTDDLSDYKGTSKTASFFGRIRSAFKTLLGGNEEETMSFEDRFMEAYKANKNITSIGWTVERSAELLPGATDETQTWLLSDGTKVTCSNYSAPDDASAAFKEAYKNVDSDSTGFTYKETLTAAKDTDRTMTDSDMYWNASNGSVIHIAAFPDESDTNVRYHYEFQYNYQDLSAYSENLVSYDKESGVHRFDYLPKGTYRIREISAPDGYVKAADKEIVVDETSDIQRYMYENKGRNLSIAKYGLVNDAYYAGNTNGSTDLTDEIGKAAVLLGFTFDVYYSENQIQNYTEAFKNGTPPAGAKLKDSFKSGTDGQYTEKDYQNFLISKDQIGDYKPHELKDVENGYYYIVETGAAAGYNLSSVIETVVTDSAADNALNITVINEPVPAKVKVVKEDEDGARLSGAGFTVTNKTLGGIVVGYLETDDMGEASLILNNPYALKADGSLAAYTFEISETKAPEGYALTDQTHLFSADPEHKDADGICIIMNTTDSAVKDGSITYVDAQTKISITKKDFGSLDEVPGTGFTVFEAEYDETAKAWKATDRTKTGWSWETTAGHDEHQLNDLAAGKTYALTETKVPAGYTKAEDIFFKVNDQGSAIEKIWLAGEENPFLSFNMDNTGAVSSVNFASRQALGSIAKVEDIEAGTSFTRGIDNSGKLTLTSTDITDGDNIRVTEIVKYSDGSEEVLASTQFRAQLYNGKTTVSLTAMLDGDSPLAYTVTDLDGNTVAAWKLPRESAVTGAIHTEANPLSDNGSSMGYVNSANTVGVNGSAVYGRKNISYEIHYSGNGKDQTDIAIIPNAKLKYSRINGESAGKYGPMDDGYYHVTGSKDGGSFILTAMVDQNATGVIVQNVVVGDRTLERVNPIAMNKESDKDKTSSLLIANEVNGNNPANAGVEFTYELTLTQNGSDSPLRGGYDWMTRSTSGRWDAFGKNKVFTFTLTGNDFLLMSGLPEGASYSVKQLSATEDGFTVSENGTLEGNTSSDSYKIAYASFDNERSVRSDRSVFKKNTSYIVNEILALKDSDARDISKHGFTLNENDTAYNIIVLNRPTEVWFSKTDWTDCKEVPGAKCTLYEQDGDGNWIPAVIGGTEITWTSTTEPTKFKGTLEAGKTYRYVEVGPPEGYAYTEAVEFTVSTDGTIDKVVMQDKLTSVSFTKEDFAGTEVPGAHVSLKGYYVNGEAADKTQEGGTWETIDAWTSSSDCIEHPHKIEGKLTPDATYRYHEDAAPDGYFYSEDIEFTLDRNGVVTDAHYIDEDGNTVIYDKNGIPNTDVKVSYDGNGQPVYTGNGETLTEENGALYRPDGSMIPDSDGFGVQIEVVDNVIRMKDGITDATFTKEDFAGDEVPDANVELKHYNKESKTWETVDSWVSEKTDPETGKVNAHEIKGQLNAGETYRYHEDAAPDGYYYSENIEFTVDRKGHITYAHYINENGDIIGYDENGYPLEVVTVKTAEDGSREFYYDGERVDEQDGVLSKNGVTIIEGVHVDIEIVDNVVRMLDAPIKVKLVKARANTNGTIKLSDGVFSIVEKLTGTVVKENFQINEELDLTKELSAGKVYLLREVSAPAGYKLADDVEFMVPTRNTDNVITVLMEDERVAMTPGFTMEKVRVTDAPEKGESGTYGFKAGDTVTYKVTVKNTGDMDLAMTVDDAFGFDDASEETTKLKEYFTMPSASDPKFYDFDKETGNKGAENSAKGTLAERVSGSTLKITLKTNAMAEILYTAVVKANAPELLAPAAADDKENDRDGYRNTATVKDITAKPENPTPGDKPEYDKKDFPELDDKKDKADTPVQVLVPSYTMEKERVTNAPAKPGTDKFGFYRNSNVDYAVTIRNTGEMDLQMTVSDRFEDSVAAYFSTPFIRGIRFFRADGTEDTQAGTVVSYSDPVSDESGIALGNNKAVIGIGVGGYAVVTYRATVAKNAPENLSNAAADDGLGYLNIASTTDVTGKYTDSDGNEHTVDKNTEYPADPENPDGEKKRPIEDQEDTANTPVQILPVFTPSYTLTKRRVENASLKGGTDDKYGFNRGDKITYEVVVTNTGDLPILTYVEDNFADDARAYFNELQAENVVFKTNETGETGTGTILTESGTGIGFTKVKIRVPVGEKAVITYSAIVSNTAPEKLSFSAADDGNGYQNIAKTIEPKGEIPPTPENPEPENPPLPPQEDDGHTPVKVPIPGYTMEKERVTDAPIKSGSTKYGFFKGDTVTYKVTVTNTGDMDLKVLVDDSFTENPEYFIEPKVDHVKFMKTSDLTENGEIGSILTREGTGTGERKVYLSLKIGGTAEVFYTAAVSDEAKEYLANTAADDRTISTDGYTNTATATEVTGSYMDANGEHTVDKNTEYPVDPKNPDGEKKRPLEDKEDTADTPVQVPVILVPRYELKKERVTNAPEKDESGKYGFRYGDTITYEVTVSNTGDMPISTLVTDEFEETAKTYFGDLKITDIRFLDAKGNESDSNGHQIADGSVTDYIGSDKAYIYVNTGCKAVVTYTATVTDKAVELLSFYQNEDDFGYVNVAKATNTKGETPPTPDNPNPDKPSLPPKDDEEKTPVQTPEPSYDMTKERVDDAPKKYGTDDAPKYGFKKGDIVTYEVTVRNSGAMQLTMDVEDHFDADVAAYFSVPEFKSADFYLANGTQSAAAGNMNTAAASGANITIEAGCKAVLKFTATVLSNAPEYLASSAKDDKKTRNDGYGNTATTTGVIAKYIDGKGNEHTFTKDDYPNDDKNPLKDREDTADTPVQEKVNVPGYELKKERVTPATAKEGADGKYGFMPGEKVVYKVVVTNTGETAIATTVSDEFDSSIASYFKNLQITNPENGSAIVFTDLSGHENAALGSVVDAAGYGIGHDKVKIKLEIGGRAEVYFTAEVSENAKELLSNAADEKDDPTGYVNIARAKDTTVPPTPPTPENPNPPDYPPLPPKEDESHTPVQTPNPSYTMTKERISLAGEKTDGTFGFKHAATVEYIVTVANTGDTTLSMNVTDQFNADAKEYFTKPLIRKADIENGELLTRSESGIGTDNVWIQLAPGGKAAITYFAKVLDTAPESLSFHAADDGLGYLNTASTKDVESTYKDKDGNEHKDTKDDFPDTPDNPLKDKEDTAHTPVQTPTPDYAMDKHRVSDAPKKNSSKYGFYRGNSVTYEVTATNTGTMDLNMLVSDSFDASVAGYFENLKVTGVKFISPATGMEDASMGSILTREGTGIGTTKVYINLKTGAKAVITYTATVSNNAPESLSNAAADDGLGYVNTATTTEVVGTYKDGEGVEHKVTKDDNDNLKDKSDTAHTPVQVTTGGGSHGGGGGGGGSDTSAKIIIRKYDSETSNALAGAVFEIYYPDGSLYQTVTTNSLGEASVRIYQTGKYTYKEIKAPDDYTADSTEGELGITTIKTYTAKVPNTKGDEPKKPEIPVEPPKPDLPNNPDTPEKPNRGTITVKYNSSINSDGNGWFDSDGKFHKFPQLDRYKTGDEYNAMLLVFMTCAGLGIAGCGAAGLKKRKKKEEQ